MKDNKEEYKINAEKMLNKLSECNQNREAALNVIEKYSMQEPLINPYILVVYSIFLIAMGIILGKIMPNWHDHRKQYRKQ